MKKSWAILILFLFSLFPFLSQAVDFPKILINELLPSPAGSDTEEEWIVLTIQLIHSVYL